MSDEKIEYRENIFAKSGFVLGIISIIIAFMPIINYMSYVIGILAILFSLISLWQKSNKQIAYFGLILGILSIIFVYIMFNYNLDFASNKIIDTNKKINNSMLEEERDQNAEDILLNELEVDIGEYKSENPEYEYNYEYNYDYMYYNSTKLPITLRNKSNEIKSFNVMIEAIDENGDRITEETVYVESLRSGQSYTTNAFEYSSGEMIEKLNNATFRVLKAYSY